MGRAKVVSTNPSRSRVFFEGLEADARKFVQDNFPRPHVEPGMTVDHPTPDVHLVTEDGSKEQYHADNGWSPVGAPAQAPVTQEGTTPYV